MKGSAHPPVGGQAVLEGVMMRTPSYWAVAVRRPDGEIAVLAREFQSVAVRHRIFRLPILRGVVALGESMAIGFKALGVSAQYAADEGDPEGLPADGAARAEADADKAAPDEIGTWSLVLSFTLAIGVALLLFKVGPGVLSKTLVSDTSSALFLVVEAAIRIAAFVLYLVALGFVRDLRRVFQFHSAEHKAINALEAGDPLEPASVQRHSRIHVRCGTAFLLWVMLVAIVVFGLLNAVVGDLSLIGVIASRILLLPVIAGLAYEIIRLAGRFGTNRAVRAVLAPGLWLQRLTTRECDESQCEVAIRALDEVLRRERAKRTGAVTADVDVMA